MATAVADAPLSPGASWRVQHTFMLTAIVTGIVAVGVLVPRLADVDRGGVTHARLFAWIVIAALLAGFAAVAGDGITGIWRGALVDNRHRVSLGRLQMVLWTVLVLSSYLAAALANVGLGEAKPLSVSVPPELWIAMGISTASFVAAPAALAARRRPGGDSSAANADPRSSGWSELLRGEERGGHHELDLAKLQMLFFTLVLILAYAVAVGDAFVRDGVPVHALPTIDSAVVVLLGISHAGYIAKKVTPAPPPAEEDLPAATSQ